MTSRLVQMQARFQQKQIQEREEKLLRMYENQQQRAYERVGGGRSSAGSNTSLNSGSNSGGVGGGKVRQIFDERRQKAGVDRSYPLEPLKTTKSTTTTATTTIMSRRGGSVDRNRTVIKTQKTAMKLQQQSRNGKTTVVQQSFNSVSNNNNNNNNNNNDDGEVLDNEQLENNYLTNNNRDIVEMMDNHNLNGFSLDDEQMPNGFTDDTDDIDLINDGGFIGKLANVGGPLPSEKVPNDERKNRKDLGKTFRKDTKPVVKKATTTTPTTRPPSGSIQRTKLTTSNSPSSTKQVKEMPTSVLKSPSPRKMSASTSTATTRRQQQQQQQQPQTQSRQTISDIGLSECKYCNRRFATDRLQVHENICMKTTLKKRKVYDATKHRVEGTELEQYVRKRGSKSSNRVKLVPPASVTPPKKDWRRTHEEFINAIRAAKQAQAHIAKGGKLSDLPPPPPSTNPDYVPCPHCGRKFNQAAAERHIPKCASFQFNKPKPGASKSKGRGRN